MCICVSISLCIHQSVCLCMSVYKSFLPICLSDIHPSSVYIFVYFCIQFICLSICHIVINPLSPSVHWSVNQSIHSIFSVCLPLFSMSVSNNSNYSPQFQIIEQAQGTCFVDESVVYQCTNLQVLGCTNAPMKYTNAQIQNFVHFIHLNSINFGKYLWFFRQFNEPPVITFCILIFLS